MSRSGYTEDYGDDDECDHGSCDACRDELLHEMLLDRAKHERAAALRAATGEG